MSDKKFLKCALLAAGLSLFALFGAGCSSEEAEEVVVEEEVEIPFVAPAALAEGNNGIHNMYCAGLSVNADGMTYFVKEAEDGSGNGTLRVVGSDGAERVLYTAAGNIEYLTATTERLYFVVTTYRANGHFEADVFCSMERGTESVTEHFTSADRIIAMAVRSDGIYYCTASEKNGSKFMKTDAVGREPEVLWEQPDLITDFIFSGEEVYFISTNRIYRSDLGGENKEELCSSLYMLGVPMVVGNLLYFVNYDSYLCPTLNVLNMSDGLITQLVSYGENIRIGYINMYANQLYLVKSTVDVEGDVLSAELVSLYNDGTGETLLYAGETEIYGLSISAGSVYFYDLAAGQAVICPLSVQ